MTVFIDTSAFYALLDRDDENHLKAKNLWRGILEHRDMLMTSNYVLVETFALLQHRLGTEAVRGFQDDIVPVVHIEFVTLELHRSGVSAFLAASRRNLSLVDCVSFEVMRALGVKKVFAFDAHFREQGFTVEP